jgi:hypothetical protein
MVQQITAVIKAIADLLIWIAFSKVIKRYPAIKVINSKMTIKRLIKLGLYFNKKYK